MEINAFGRHADGDIKSTACLASGDNSINKTIRGVTVSDDVAVVPSHTPVLVDDNHSSSSKSAAGDYCHSHVKEENDAEETDTTAAIPTKPLKRRKLAAGGVNLLLSKR